MRLRLPLLTVLALMALAGMAQAATNTKPQPRLELQHRAIGADGVQHLHFRFGPVRITPGQNVIRFDATRGRPKVVHPFMRGAFRVKG